MAAYHLNDATLSLLFSILAIVSLVGILGRLLCNRHQILLVFKWFLTRISKGCRYNETPDAICLLACEELLQRKVRNYRNLMQFYAFCILLVIGNIIINLNGPELRLHTLMQDAVMAAGQMLSLLVCVCPGVITEKTLDFFYVSNMGLATLYVAPFACTPAYLLPALLIGNCCMAIFNIFRRTVPQRKTPVFLLCNIVFLACASNTILAHGRERFGKHVMEVACLQVFIVSTFNFGAVSLEKGFMATLQQSLQLEEVKELHAAACALLRSFCECTVELDEEGVIVSSTDELGSYLMKGSFSYSLQGRRFVDLFVDEEERDVFQVRLKEPKMKRIGLAEVMPVSMRDVCGNVLRLELLWFEFRRIDRSLRYMLGVREMSDCLPNYEPPPQRGASPKRTIPSDAEDSFTDAGVDQFSVTSDDPAAAILVVDTIQDGFPIVGQTQALTALIGRLPKGGRLADFVKKPGRFMRWVQAAVMDEQPNTGAVSFILPWGRFGAQCKVLVRDSESSGMACLDNVGILITNVTRISKKGPSQLRGTPSNGSSPTVSL